jgi:hypothetical protein
LIAAEGLMAKRRAAARIELPRSRIGLRHKKNL